MERYPMPVILIDDEGRLADGVGVTIHSADGAPAAVFAAPEGDERIASPRSGPDGGVPGWVVGGRYTCEAATGSAIVGATFRTGDVGAPQPLATEGGWADYPGYAAATYAEGTDGEIEVLGVFKAPEDRAPGVHFARLPAGLAPGRTRKVAAALGIVTPTGVVVRPGFVVALTDGGLRAPNEPCKWLSLTEPLVR